MIDSFSRVIMINYCDHCVLYFCRFVCFLIAICHCFPTVIVLVMNTIIRIATVTSQTKQEDFQKVIEHYGLEERRRYNQEKAKARWWSIDFLLALNVK